MPNYNPYAPVAEKTPKPPAFGEALVQVPEDRPNPNNHPIRSALGGLAGGALAGAALGPVGAVLGALGGGLYGYSANKHNDQDYHRNLNLAIHQAQLNNAQFGVTKERMYAPVAEQYGQLANQSPEEQEAWEYAIKDAPNLEEANKRLNDYQEYLKKFDTQHTNRNTNAAPLPETVIPGMVGQAVQRQLHPQEQPSYTAGQYNGGRQPMQASAQRLGQSEPLPYVIPEVEPEKPITAKALGQDPRSFVNPGELTNKRNANTKEREAAVQEKRLPSEINRNDAQAALSQSAVPLNQAKTKETNTLLTGKQKLQYAQLQELVARAALHARSGPKAGAQKFDAVGNAVGLVDQAVKEGRISEAQGLQLKIQLGKSVSGGDEIQIQDPGTFNNTGGKTTFSTSGTTSGAQMAPIKLPDGTLKAGRFVFPALTPTKAPTAGLNVPKGKKRGHLEVSN